MPRIQWTLSEDDAKEYDLTGPQILDTDALRKLRFSELEAIEKVLIQRAGLRLLEIYPLAEHNQTMSAMRALSWLTLWLNGRRVEWEDFNPRGLDISFDLAEDDVDPPANSPDGDSLPAE